MRLPSNPARAFVFDPPELAAVLIAQFEGLGIAAEAVPSPTSEEALSAWLKGLGANPSTFIHPGLSPWADRPEFPQIVGAAGYFPVSASPRALSLCLNQLNVLLEAEAAGIPHLAISLNPLSSVREVEAELARAGARFPVVLKSMKNAEGHGIQVIADAGDLRARAPLWFEQLVRLYGEASVVIERCLPSARHLVVPFAADGSRFLTVFPMIDASLQTRWRRMIQFAPAEGLGDALSAKVRECAERWVRQTGFRGLGSLDFLVEEETVYVVDATARLNFSFALWEELCGVRSVEWQLAALGQIPTPEPPAGGRFGAGLSLRFHAEDPLRHLPSPGVVREITPSFSREHGDFAIRWQTRYGPGDEIGWESSGTLGELFVFGPDRAAAIREARSAIREIWIAGSLVTNQRFLLGHLEHPFVRENLIHAGFTDEDFIPEADPSPEDLDAIAALATRFPRSGGRWAIGSRWAPPDPDAVPDALVAEGFVSRDGLPGLRGSVRRKGRVSRFRFEPTGEDRWLATFEGWNVPVRYVYGRAPGPETVRKLFALAAGRVHALLRQPGEVLEPGDRACVIESLGVLVSHAIPLRARLVEWKVAPGTVVGRGQELAVFERLG